jgi:outer membrane protein assembly factor BamD (BamD/ComL family)
MGMPIGSASAASAYQPTGAGGWQQRQQGFQALSQALQSGNLGAAQQAYASVSSSLPASATSNPNSPLAQIGQALQSGNLSAAQSAFSALRGHHHHHHGGRASSASQAAVSSAAATSGVGSTLDVQA